MSKRWSLATTVILIIIIALLSNAYNVLQGKNVNLQDKLTAAENANKGLRDDIDKLIRYHECIGKIFILPPDGPKGIEGDVNDPATALENCRIKANEEAGVSSDGRGSFSPTDQALEQPPHQDTTPQTPQNQETPDNSSPDCIVTLPILNSCITI